MLPSIADGHPASCVYHQLERAAGRSIDSARRPREILALGVWTLDPRTMTLLLVRKMPSRANRADGHRCPRVAPGYIALGYDHQRSSTNFIACMCVCTQHHGSRHFHSFRPTSPVVVQRFLIIPEFTHPMPSVLFSSPRRTYLLLSYLPDAYWSPSSSRSSPSTTTMSPSSSNSIDEEESFEEPSSSM